MTRLDPPRSEILKRSVSAALPRTLIVASMLVDEQCLIPDGIASLADFRRWALATALPPRGRIDWIGSRIEVDISPEDTAA